ncbi:MULTISPECIES: glutathione S-transferase N-terminal domain-containing protein [Ectothiorhodospira]|jgi:RNA polymerase-associated protein|uniref:RNA polymerase-associated protein n=1 Tax=Ectothiorhodospira marina TaxID=1396821 RepID=A0A1H7H7S0_9GAMM|nr:MULTISPECIES: glutathione S-transferase N-terminal domain-containing protein [Ectothiorhodospira]MCG5515094.1 glutathione S-transferase N-terminal domain-containing protein [Ectothiorhodospira sp. 9100]SEK46483.1 RNA polymerase-associated protein [Ectothiorhodospira marina]
MALVANRRSVMTLFSAPACPRCHAVRIVLAEKDITVDITHIDTESRPEDLSHLNPYNSVPTLVDRDLVLYGTQVIQEYLDERFPHPPLMPVDPVSRATARLALYRIEQDWYRGVENLEAASDKASANRARKILLESLVSSSEIFAIKPYFLSDEFSLVDAAVAPVLWRLPSLGIPMDKLPKPMRDYARRVFAREAFQHSLTEAEKEMH